MCRPARAQDGRIQVWHKQLSTFFNARGESDTHAFLVYHRVPVELGVQEMGSTQGVPLRVHLLLGAGSSRAGERGQQERGAAHALGLQNALGYEAYEGFTGALVGRFSLDSALACDVEPYGVFLFVLRPVHD